MHWEEIGSPGLGTTPMKLSLEPLATEGEATLGPDEEVDVEELAEADMGLIRSPVLEDTEFEEPVLPAIEF